MDLNSSEDEEQDRGADLLLRSSKRRCAGPLFARSFQRRSRHRFGRDSASQNSVERVGKRITVFWESDEKWYSGKIREYSPADETCLVVYDDGTQSSEDLDDCIWVWEDDRPTSGADEVADEVPTEAGGLKLHLSQNGSTGYLHVYLVHGRFRARITAIEGGGCLGAFDTAVEAAVAVAKKLLEPTQSLVKEAEGLKLHLSNKSRTGYLHVIDQGSRFRASACGKFHLGRFASAVEAATAVARWYLQDNDNGGEEDQAGAAEDEDEDDEEDEDEGVVTTEAEGLTLHLSSQNRTGYLHVTRTGFSRFRAEVRGGTGAPLTLGHYDTAVEAAVAVARHRQNVEEEEKEEAEEEEEEEGEKEGEKEGEEEGVVTEAEGIKLHLSAQNKTGYFGITVRSRYSKTFYEANPSGHHYLGSFASAVEAAVAIARHLQAANASAAAIKEEGVEDEQEVEVEVEEAAEQRTPDEQPRQSAQQQPGQQPESPEQPAQPEEEEQQAAVLLPGQLLARLESRLGTDAPQGANVLQRIVALEAGMDLTTIGSWRVRIAALEAKAAEWLL